MDTYKPTWTRLQTEIFRYLCIKVGRPHNQREIALNLKVSPTAVAKALPELQKGGIIKIEKLGNMNLNRVELNRESGFAISLKRAENLKMIYESGILDSLIEIFPGTTIVLFGSYSKGEDTIKSDIDIAIVGTKEKEVDLPQFEKILERQISLHLFPSLKELSKEFKENLFNGIVLVGGIEL